MSRMYFFIGLFSTLGIGHSLMQWHHWFDLLVTNLMSLAGGVVAAVVVAWLQHKWKAEQE